MQVDTWGRVGKVRDESIASARERRGINCVRGQKQFQAGETRNCLWCRVSPRRATSQVADGLFFRSRVWEGRFLFTVAVRSIQTKISPTMASPLLFTTHNRRGRQFSPSKSHLPRGMTCRQTAATAAETSTSQTQLMCTAVL